MIELVFKKLIFKKTPARIITKLTNPILDIAKQNA